MSRAIFVLLVLVALNLLIQVESVASAASYLGGLRIGRPSSAIVALALMGALAALFAGILGRRPWARPLGYAYFAFAPLNGAANMAAFFADKSRFVEAQGQLAALRQVEYQVPVETVLTAAVVLNFAVVAAASLVAFWILSRQKAYFQVRKVLS